MDSASPVPPPIPGNAATADVDLDAIARRFQRTSMAEAYSKRAPYPPAIDDILLDLLGNSPRIVLDLGCGPGTLARRLAPRVTRVDAVDFSPAMIAEGKRLPGGDHPAIRWICGNAEDVPLTAPYSLITAGKSLHWMRYEIVLPRCRPLLSASGVLAIVNVTRYVPWKEEESRLLARYATVRNHLPAALVEELKRKQLFRPVGEQATEEIVVRQTVEDYVDSFQSKEAFCREDLRPENAARFQRDFKRLLAEYADDDQLDFTICGRVVWGHLT